MYAGLRFLAEGRAWAVFFKIFKGILMPKQTPASEKNPLQKEIETYQMEMSKSKPENMGKFALIKGEGMSVFLTRQEALKEGYKRYGLKPFLVKEIRPLGTEPVANYTRSFIA